MFKSFLAGLLLLVGCNPPDSLQKFSETRAMFGSFVRLDVCYAPSQQPALEAAVSEIWLRFEDIHKRLSVYDPQSDLNRINHSYPDVVTVGADTWMLLSKTADYNQLSGGEFDITIYPLLKLWKDSEKNGVLPTAEQIEATQQAMGMDKLELLPGNQVRLLNPAVQLTIDSIADGYAGDEAARILRAHGLSHFLIDATGELYAGGKSCDGRPWRVGVKDPEDPFGEQVIHVLNLQDKAVTTSGNYERFYTIAGKRYSHIISPQTGFPREEIVSATVIAPNAEMSDFLSTALCLMEPSQGIALLDSLGAEFAGMILVNEGRGRLIPKESLHYKRYADQ